MSLLRVCAGLAVLGCLVSIGSNIVGSIVVPGYSFVADTISDLGAGQYEIFQDLGMYGFAMALNMCAIAAAHLHAGTKRWTAGVLGVAILATLVVVIAARNEYGDGDDEGIIVHRYLVVALAAIFPAVALLFRRGFGEIRKRYATISLGCAIAWILCAPLFLILPTTVDGLWERALALILVVWVLLFAKIMVDSARCPAAPETNR